MATDNGQRSNARQIEVFSAGCLMCNRAIERLVKLAAAEGHELRIHDMHNEHVARRAEELGVRSVPAVAVVAAGQNGRKGAFPPMRAMRLAVGIDEQAIREALAG